MTYFILLLFVGVKLYIRNTNPKYQSILLALFLIAVYTTFHAAMRTYVTPLLIGLSLIKIDGIMESDVLIKSKLSGSKEQMNSQLIRN
jgi:hypothetical protein